MSRNPIADDYEASLHRRTRADAGDLPLFAPTDPEWLLNPGSVIECKFKAFHEANLEVYAKLEAAALGWARTGPKRVGVARLVENMRYSAIEIDRRFWYQYKLNNDARALYARLLIHRHPELADVIETRRRREEGASVE